MKIIKQGQIVIPQPRLYRGECSKCHCVIEVEESEVSFTDNRPPCYRHGCPTPNCHHHTINVIRHNYRLPAATETKTVTWRTTSGARVKGAFPT